MNSFFKKRNLEETTAEPSSKRGRLNSTDSDLARLNGSPRVVAAWNCNGLTSRIRSASDAQQIKAFIIKYKPDTLFLSEVRLPAANNSSNGKPGPNTKWFRSRIKESDKKSMEDIILVRNFFNSPEFAGYKIYYSLADTKYAGTAMLLNTRTTRAPKSIRYNMERIDVKGSVHDSEGRVIVAKFADFSILHTYSPNNGWEESHFKRRRAWDESVRSFMERKREAGVRIIWVGDLNVAPRDEDLSHPAYFRRQKGGRNASRKGLSQAVTPENIGQPGCTDREREGLNRIMENGGLVDAFRELVCDEECSTFTWRGNSSGKHAGRGMRIDHCLASKALMSDMESVEVTGIEKNQAGFMGSDHCPVLIRMKDISAQDGSCTKSPGKAKEASPSANSDAT